MSTNKLNNVEFSAAGLREFARAKYGSLNGLAKAMSISQPHLSAYLNGSRVWGASFKEKLRNVGFIDGRSDTHIKELNKVESDINKCKDLKVPIDIRGAVDLTRTQIERLAKLIQASPEELKTWDLGEAAPTLEQLGALFNQVVALGLARCVADKEARAAIQYQDPMRRKAVG